MQENKVIALRVIGFLDQIPRYSLHDFVIACHVLGVLGDPVAIPSLINLLKKQGENRTKYDQYLMEVDRYVKKAATDALVGIGEEAVQPLIELLKSEYIETKKYAAYALGKIGDRRAFPALVEVVKNHYRLAREVAGRALSQIDPKTAAEIIETDNLFPTQYPFPNINPRAEFDLETIEKYYNSMDDLGPPSEYKLSISLYESIEKEIYDYDEELEAVAENLECFSERTHTNILRELSIPQEIIDKLAKHHFHQLLCLCGEYLEVKYVDRLSNRVYHYEDHREGRCTITRNVMCVYCKNCKRYTGLEKSLEDSLHPPKHPNFFWFYLPRYPKQTELLTWRELKSKPPKLIKDYAEDESPEEEP